MKNYLALIYFFLMIIACHPLFAQYENQAEDYVRDLLKNTEKLNLKDLDASKIKKIIQKSKNEYDNINQRKQLLEVNLMSNKLRKNINLRGKENLAREIENKSFSEKNLDTVIENKNSIANNAPNEASTTWSQEKELQLLQEIEEKKRAEIAALTNTLELQANALAMSNLQLRNQYYVGGVVFLFLSLVVLNLYRGNKQKKKMNLLLSDEKVKTEKERDKSDELLLNILPLTVAQELKTNGKAQVRTYDLASVLFTDFKGFTSVAEKMTPSQLVEELDACFAKFDEIITNYNLEKIKTIGDAYMCVGGIPDANQSNPIEAILAGLAIQDFMNQKRNEKLAQGQNYWQCRLGINSGELIAGVIGKKKFAYDVWGDTVNTGSRMESSGEVGRVNISGNTYDLVKDYFECEYRGKVDAKGKGEIDMYFVNRIKPEYAADSQGIVPNEILKQLIT